MTIEERIRQIEEDRGKKLILRGIRTPNPRFRGRIIERPRYIVVEYRDDEPGYFWHYDIIQDLLDAIERRVTNVTLFEGGFQFVELPPE
ncbi:MAG: hypothetical protein ACE5O2_05320 [Armatimonadota bacterium]